MNRSLSFRPARMSNVVSIHDADCLFSLPQRQRAHFQIDIHLGVYVGLLKAMPFDAMLPEFVVASLYAPRGEIRKRKSPVTIWRSAANYSCMGISLSMHETLTVVL